MTTTSPTEGPYAGANIDNGRRFASILWLVGLPVVGVLSVFFPPTDALGATAGWTLFGAGVLGAVVANVHLHRHPVRLTFATLLAMSWVGLVGIGFVQWLAGGRDAPYHELLLPLSLGTAMMHPARRVLAFLAAMLGLLLLPLAYGQMRGELGDALVEAVLWTTLSLVGLGIMQKVREQRLGLTRDGDEARALALADPLTGLGNRRAFDHALAVELEHAQIPGRPVSLLVGDLDAFKEVNDRHGHLAGDQALAAVADALRASARGQDRAFRWGGDEFAVLLPGTDLRGALEAATRLEAATAERCRLPGGESAHITFGAAQLEDGMSAEELLRAADDALLQLKDAAPAAF